MHRTKDSCYSIVFHNLARVVYGALQNEMLSSDE